MNAFPRNRYDAAEFVRGFDSAHVGRDGNEVCISFAVSNPENDEMLVYFPGCASDPPPELLQLARLTCSHITELDNAVQNSCEEEWRRHGRRSDDYELYLAHIIIEPKIVQLEYYGSKVNTQWTAKFIPVDGECWKKANF